MNSPACILCNSTSIATIEQIDTLELASLYESRARVNVRDFFKTSHITYCICKDCSLKFYWPLLVGDGKFYDNLQKYKGYYLKEKLEFKEASRFVKKSDTVLEIGCGEGLFYNYIDCGSYVGLEFSSSAIEKANKKGLKVLNQNIEEHALHNEERYDVVCFFQVLEHVEHPGNFIRHALRCLKSNGLLLLAVPSEDSFITSAVNFYLNMPPHHASRWTDDALKKIAIINGLELRYLYHEPLHSIHEKFFIKTKVYNKLSNLFKLNPQSIRLGVFDKVLYGIGTISSFFMKSDTFEKSPRGQSVLAVYVKP